jgi:hypothetical protein
LNKQDELAKDRKHRNKYKWDNGEDGRHLQGVETSTRTGETDQSMTLRSSHYLLFFTWGWYTLLYPFYKRITEIENI